MTPERAKELLPIIQAYSEHKTIQFRDGPGTWKDVAFPNWYSASEFRIKPEPREIWVNCYGGRLGQIHTSKEAAEDNADVARTECIHFREVLP